MMEIIVARAESEGVEWETMGMMERREREKEKESAFGLCNRSLRGTDAVLLPATINNELSHTLSDIAKS